MPVKSLLLAILVWLPQASTSARLTLEGRVLRTGTEDPVPTASIVVAKVGGELQDYRESLSDESGRFVFPDLSAGTYRVYATRTGYLRSEYGRLGRSFGPGTRITLGDKQPRANILISMTPYGVITGTVRDSEGKPLRNVWVRALRADYRSGERQLEIAGFAQTNDLGEYRIFDLPPDQYFINATLDRPRINGDSYDAPAMPIQIRPSDRAYSLTVRTPGARALAEGLVGAAAFDQRVFFPVYYPNARNASDAVPVEVKAGASVPLADLAMVPTPTVHVRGRIVNGVTGELVPNMLVAIPPLPSTRSSGTGLFDIPGVPPGRYELSSDAFPLLLMGATRIEVADRDVEGITLILHPKLTVTGRMTIDGRNPGSNAARFSVQLVGIEGRAGRCCSAVEVQPDGSFTVNNVSPDEYAVRVHGQNFFLKEAKFGGADVSSTRFDVNPGSSRQQLSIDISLHTATLETRVLDRNQQPVAGVPVVLVPEPRRRNRPELYATTISDGSGRARLEGLTPGDYKVFASQDIQPAAWRNPTLLNLYESLGVSVYLSENAKKEVAVRVISSQP